jgi:hypothetical protein
MAEKAHERLAKAAGVAKLTPEELQTQIGDTLRYNRISGNSYAASLYVGLDLRCWITQRGGSVREPHRPVQLRLRLRGRVLQRRGAAGVSAPACSRTSTGRMLERPDGTDSSSQYEDIFNLAVPDRRGSSIRFAPLSHGPFPARGRQQS